MGRPWCQQQGSGRRRLGCWGAAACRRCGPALGCPQPAGCRGAECRLVGTATAGSCCMLANAMQAKSGSQLDCQTVLCTHVPSHTWLVAAGTATAGPPDGVVACCACADRGPRFRPCAGVARLWGVGFPDAALAHLTVLLGLGLPLGSVDSGARLPMCFSAATIVQNRSTAASLHQAIPPSSSTSLSSRNRILCSRAFQLCQYTLIHRERKSDLTCRCLLRQLVACRCFTLFAILQRMRQHHTQTFHKRAVLTGCACSIRLPR